MDAPNTQGRDDEDDDNDNDNDNDGEVAGGANGVRWNRTGVAVLAVVALGTALGVALPVVVHGRTPDVAGWFASHPEWDASKGETPNYNNTLYVLPIWEDLHVGNLSADLEEAKNLKATLGTGGKFAKVGFSCSCWYSHELYGADRDYEFNPFASLCHKLNLSVASGLPVLFHMNGGNWGTAFVGSAWANNQTHLVVSLWDNKSNLQWDQHDGVPAKENDHPGLRNRLFTLARASEFNLYRERNLKIAGRVIANFGREHPELFAGCSTDSEIHLNSYGDGLYYDYNPLVISEFREWLAGEYGSIRDLNAAAGTSFADFDAVDPPRERSDGDPWWELWTRFRVELVRRAVEDQTRWLVEAGIPREKIYTHQILSDADSESANYARCDPIRTTEVAFGNIGVTKYGYIGPSAFRDMYQRGGPTWGVFEFNMPRDHDYGAYIRMFRVMYSHGLHIVCPYAWHEWTWPDLYMISNDTSFTSAIRDFTRAVQDHPRGRAPAGKVTGGDALYIGQLETREFLDDELWVISLPAIGGVSTTLVLRKLGSRRKFTAKN
ncbi:MAG: beta-galactosidase [Promethearchaeota archaeon]